MGQGSGAAGAGHSPVSHLRDDVVPVLVVCAKRGVVSLGPVPPTTGAEPPPPPHPTPGTPTLTRLSAAEVKSQPVGQLILALHQSLCQLVLGCLPVRGRAGVMPTLGEGYRQG